MLVFPDPESTMLYTSFLKNAVLGIDLLTAADPSTTYQQPMASKELRISN